MYGRGGEHHEAAAAERRTRERARTARRAVHEAGRRADTAGRRTHVSCFSPVLSCGGGSKCTVIFSKPLKDSVAA